MSLEARSRPSLEDFLQLENDDARAQAIYAYYGLACYAAQVFEQGMILYASSRHVLAGKVQSHESFGGLMDSFANDTLGKILKSIKGLKGVSTVRFDEIHAVLRKRNWLVHRYFYDRALDWYAETGQIKMITELVEVRELFFAEDMKLQEETRAFNVRIGLTEDMLAKTLDDMMRQYLESL